MEKVLIISGQTSAGKTDVGVQLVKKYNGEIVSFDSRQAYTHTDIMTGKDFDSAVPFKIESIHVGGRRKNLRVYFKENIPIWMYDLFDPKEIIDVSLYFKYADSVIEHILSKEKLPIIVGGTHFYIKGFTEGIETLGVAMDEELRKKLSSSSVEDLQKELIKIDKQKWLQMNHSDQYNPRRLIRAIEVAESKNKKSFIPLHSYDYLMIALIASKEYLRKKIELRVAKRLEEGALEETQKLLDMGYTFFDPGLNANGYKQLKEYFLKKKSLDEAIEDWTRGEVDHTRRQLIFLNKMESCISIDVEEKGNIEKTEDIVYKWLNDAKN